MFTEPFHRSRITPPFLIFLFQYLKSKREPLIYINIMCVCIIVCILEGFCIVISLLGFFVILDAIATKAFVESIILASEGQFAHL